LADIDQHELERVVAGCHCRMVFPSVIDVPLQVFDDFENLLDARFGPNHFWGRVDDEAQNLPELYQAIATTCKFPERWDFNWNAMRDKLLDFSWLATRPTGITLLYRRPDLLSWQDLAQFFVLVDSVQSTYANHRKPFKVLLPQRL
jgi:hypothetical protein